MSLSFRSNNRSKSRRREQVSAPAEIETFESRLLLTTPGVLTPSGVIDLDAAVDGSAPTIEFSWEAVDGAVSYDLWVSSLGSFEQILLVEDIAGTTTDIPVTDLAEGRMRVWARANLEDGSVSDWSAGRDFELNTRPVLTGPGVGNSANLTSDTTPEITWTSANEARLFQLWLTDLTTGTVTRYDVENLTPLLDDNGDPVLDFAGQEQPQEIRSFQIPDADALEIGRYRLWVRSIDIDGGISSWSDSRDFNVGPAPVNLSPAAPSFSFAPLLTWDAVGRATGYEVFVVSSDGDINTPLFRETVDTTEFQIPVNLARGEYVFWVRAVISGTGIPTVYGAWSDPSSFGTLVPPTVTGPVGAEGFVTELRPTVEWTPIHGAATYEVLVHKRNSRPPFLETRSNATSMTFAADLAPGTYTVWVRAVDTRGRFSDWSDPLFFEATGGRTVITAPVEGETVDFPTFTWVAVTDAVSYEVWVSEVGGQSPFLNVTGLTGTSYTPIDASLPSSQPFPDGTYRIWVRAIFADGTTSPWSAPVTFIGGVVAENEVASSVDIQLASLQSDSTVESESAAPVRQPDDRAPVETAGESYVYAVESPTEVADAVTSEHAAEMPADVLAQLAKDCVDAEWWADPNASA